jgi:type I restriction enzyme, S subunit
LLRNTIKKTEIVHPIDPRFSLADKPQTRTRPRASVSQLAASVLAKVFRGELVPQDPTSAPADVLLARVRGEASSRRDGDVASSAAARDQPEGWLAHCGPRLRPDSPLA